MHQAILSRAAKNLDIVRAVIVALHSLVVVLASSAGHQGARRDLRRSGDRSLWDDGSRASDGEQPAAARQAQAGHGRAGGGARSVRDRRRGQSAAVRCRRRNRDQGRERHAGIREQPEGQRRSLCQELVSHRRSGRHGCGGLRHHHRSVEGNHQPRAARKYPRARWTKCSWTTHRSSNASRSPFPTTSWARMSPLPSFSAKALQASEKDLREFAAIRLADFKVPRKILILAGDPEGSDGEAAAHRPCPETGPCVTAPTGAIESRLLRQQPLIVATCH